MGEVGVTGTMLETPCVGGAEEGRVPLTSRDLAEAGQKFEPDE